jgi:hypothetical protein
VDGKQVSLYAGNARKRVRFLASEVSANGIVWTGLESEDSIAELCRRKCFAQSLFFSGSKANRAAALAEWRGLCAAKRSVPLSL